MRLAFRHDELVVYTRALQGEEKRQYLAKVLYTSERRIRLVFPVANDRAVEGSREVSVSPSRLRAATYTDLERAARKNGVVGRPRIRRKLRGSKVRA